MSDRNIHRHILNLATGHGLEHIESHDQHTGQEQDTTQPTDRPERVGALNGFDEAVSQRAVSIHCAPHQALHHTGNPHRSNIENGADGSDPEVGRNQLGAIHFGLAEELWQQVVDGA